MSPRRVSGVLCRCASGAILSAVLLIPLRAPALPDSPSELDAALRLTPDLVRGAETFQSCAACHGADGAGVTDGSVPAIAGQHVAVLIKQIIDFRHDARLNIRMQHFVDNHHLAKAQDIADVAAYASSLPLAPLKDLGDPQLAAHGAGVYARSCATCHGANGEGDARARVPRLAGQRPEYTATQLHDAAEGRRLAMERDHARIVARMDARDIAGIAVCLARMGAPR